MGARDRGAVAAPHRWSPDCAGALRARRFGALAPWPATVVASARAEVGLVGLLRAPEDDRRGADRRLRVNRRPRVLRHGRTVQALAAPPVQVPAAGPQARGRRIARRPADEEVSRRDPRGRQRRGLDHPPAQEGVRGPTSQCPHTADANRRPRPARCRPAGRGVGHQEWHRRRWTVPRDPRPLAARAAASGRLIPRYPGSAGDGKDSARRRDDRRPPCRRSPRRRNRN